MTLIMTAVSFSLWYSLARWNLKRLSLIFHHPRPHNPPYSSAIPPARATVLRRCKLSSIK